MMKIGFCTEERNEQAAFEAAHERANTILPRKSVVQVEFPGGEHYAYYNDAFDLLEGDMVYVEGTKAGIRGRVTEVNYNFKIKRSAYKKVISLIDTEVHGQFYCAGSHFVTFHPEQLPPQQVRTWFFAPLAEEDEIVTGGDGSEFPLENLGALQVSPQIAARGHEYYTENRVKYLCIYGGKGYAIVEGSEPYEVEFDFHDGMIANLVCSCYCTYHCKHEFAAMLQLMETLEQLRRNYPKQLKESDSFAAIFGATLFAVSIDGKEQGSINL